MKRANWIPAILAPAALLVSVWAWNNVTVPHTPAEALTAPAASLIVTDTGCILASGDLVTVSVSPNTLVYTAYLDHIRHNVYFAPHLGYPPVRDRYYIRFYGAKPWGLWLTRRQFIRFSSLHINCRGGKLGNMDQPPWAQHPWPGGGSDD